MTVNNHFMNQRGEEPISHPDRHPMMVSFLQEQQTKRRWGFKLGKANRWRYEYMSEWMEVIKREVDALQIGNKYTTNFLTYMSLIILVRGGEMKDYVPDTSREYQIIWLNSSPHHPLLIDPGLPFWVAIEDAQRRQFARVFYLVEDLLNRHLSGKEIS